MGGKTDSSMVLRNFRGVRFGRPRLAGAGLAILSGAVLTSLAQENVAVPVVDLETHEVMADPIGGYRVPVSLGAGFRAQPVLDTPFSVSAFSADFIKDIQARTLLDITRNDPSVTQAEDPLFYDRVIVRGFYLSTDAVFRDGLGINDQGTIALDNKQAVEITKGLSSNRQGITSPGGTINYVVKRPSVEALTQVGASVDGFGSYGASADVSRRFGEGDRFGVRVNVAADEIRTFLDDVEGNRVFAAAAFEWQATERLLLESELEFQDRELTSVGTLGIWAFADEATARALLPRLGPKNQPRQAWAVEPNQQLYYSGRATYEIAGGWRVRVAAQRGELSRDQRGISAENIQANGDYDVAYYFNPSQERNNTGILGVIEGDVETGPIRHELAFGYDYIRREMTSSEGDFYGVIGSSNLFDEVAVPEVNPTVGPSVLQFRSDQTSLFVTNTAKIGELIQVFGGARLTRLENRNRDAGVLRETYDKEVVTPTVGVVVKPHTGLSLYVSYAEGIEQGGTAPDTAVNAREIFDPLRSEQVEIGAKWEITPRALLTVAAFEIDKGLEFLDPGSNLYVQNGRQVHRGVEATLAGSLGEQLRVIAGAAWLDAAVEATDDPALVGKRPQGVPEWQANLYADYDLSPMLDGLAVNAGLYYGGEKPIDLYETWSADAYVRFDAGLRYRHRVGDQANFIWRLAVENLTDEVYLANTTFGYLNFGTPRTVKLSLTVDF